MNKLIVFTNKGDFKPVPKALFGDEEDEDSFGLGNFNTLVMGLYSRKALSDDDLENTKWEKYDCLILLDIYFSKVDLRKYTAKFAANSENIFIVQHKKSEANNKMITDNLLDILAGKKTFFSYQSHIRGDFYYEELIHLAEAARDRNELQYGKILQGLSDNPRFYEPAKEDRIRLFKELGLIRLGINRKKIIDANLAKQLDDIFQNESFAALLAEAEFKRGNSAEFEQSFRKFYDTVLNHQENKHEADSN